MRLYSLLNSKLTICILTFYFLFSITSIAQWVTKSNAHKKRSEVTSVVYNGKLYAFIGFSDSNLNVEPSVEMYDPGLNKWSLLNSLPLNKTVTHQGVVLIDNKVWHIGGRVGKHPGDLTSEIWIYDIPGNVWYRGPQLKDPDTGTPLLWGGGGAALMGRTLHVFGGFVNNACNSDQSNYHLTIDIDYWLANQGTSNWKNDRAALPVKRNHFGTAVLGGQIYAIGGQFGHDCNGGEDKQYSHVYNPETNDWKELPLLPSPRSHFEGSIFVIDGKIYIAAGQTTNDINTNKVTIFDPGANNGQGTWTEDINLTLPASYEGLSAKVIDNNFIISHGGQGSSRNTKNTTFSRTISRNPQHKLGFPVAATNLQAAQGSVLKKTTLVYTIDGNCNYTISSNAAWLSISRNAIGTTMPAGKEIEYTVNTSGLAPGSYTALVTAASYTSPLYEKANYTVNLNVQSTTAKIETTPELVFSGVKGTTSAEKSVIISNIGAGPLQITNLTTSGNNSSAFFLSNAPTPPFTIAAGATQALSIKFTPSTLVGALSAQLNISSTASNEGLTTVGLYGLSANGEQGNNEPPLDRVVKTLGYNINVGGTTLILSTGPAAIGEEVLTPLFKKAGDGLVTMKAVARYSPDGLLPFGFYTKPNGNPVVQKVGTIALDQEQTLNPLITTDSKTTFDPGSSEFGFYTGATSYSNRNTYTEDHLNSGGLTHAVRIYPLKNRTGTAIANSYLVAFEPAVNGDYQDYVFEITNVKPAGVVTSGVLEAELATLNSAIVGSNHAGFTGTGFADFVNTSGDYVEWNFNKSNSTSTRLSFRYANGASSNRPLRLEVNGVIVSDKFSFIPTGAWNKWSTSAINVNLVAGANKVRLTAIGSSGGNIDHLSWSDIIGEGGLLEAELATLNTAIAASIHTGYTGTGYADYVNTSGDYIEWSFNKTNSGPSQLSFRYANGASTNRPLKLEVNGVVVSEKLAFPSTAGWSKWSTVVISVNLVSGVNKIRLTAIGSSGGNIDHLSWSETTSINSAAIAAIETGMRPIETEFSVSVSPNPATGITLLNLKTSSLLPAEIKLIDLMGRTLKFYSIRDTKDRIRIPVDNLPPGIYIIHAKQGNKITYARLIVKH